MKHFFKINIICWIIIIFLAAKGFAQTLPPSNKNVSPADKKPIDITADHVVQEGEKDIIRAWGGVVIHFENRVLRADKVILNNKTGIGEAKGHVIVDQDDGTHIRAQRSRFNIKTKRGKAFQVFGKIAPNYYFKGKEITRLSENHYKLKDSSLTTCKGHLPDWMFQASKVDLITKDRALFTSGIFKIRNIPILYFPVGYISINRERKSGLLIPGFGLSNTDGFTFKPIYYWAINSYSDATIGVEYLQNRGVRPDIEYRYTPSKTTRGEFRGTYLKDKQTNGTFWKVDMTHEQKLPGNYQLKGKLDLESDSSFNKTFANNTNQRTRRNSDSFANITKSWTNSSLDILTRFRDSTEGNRDDTFGQLPQITYKSQRQPIRGTSFFFNQDTSFTSFLLDLNPDPVVDDDFQVQRIDFHPQFSRPFHIAQWLAFTPTLGLRETLYSQGIGKSKNRLSAFSREIFDVNAVIEGPKFNKIINTGSSRIPRLKHVIEPRVSYDFIPDVDGEDRDRIRRIDAIDTVDPLSRFTYFLTQRLLQKEALPGGGFQTKEIARFEVSQSYNVREATRAKSSGIKLRPFSDLRFDLDSRPLQSLLINVDATYDAYKNWVKTLNFEVGIKPTDKISFFVERRFTRRQSTFLVGSLFWSFLPGWQMKATTRFDELTQTFRENDFSLLYDDKCQCWGFGLDFIKRKIISNGINRDETRFLLTITLRGIGTEKFGRKDMRHIHRTF
ncbi:MAG: LPS-assembly protein LptD [Nitrospinaceae bacterium]